MSKIAPLNCFQRLWKYNLIAGILFQIKLYGGVGTATGRNFKILNKLLTIVTETIITVIYKFGKGNIYCKHTA